MVKHAAAHVMVVCHIKDRMTHSTSHSCMFVFSLDVKLPFSPRVLQTEGLNLAQGLDTFYNLTIV